MQIGTKGDATDLDKYYNAVYEYLDAAKAEYKVAQKALDTLV